MSKQKIDWHRAKKEFLHNKNMSLKDVANKYGISYSYIRKIAMKQGWWAEKKEFWKEVTKMFNKEMQRIIKRKVKGSYKTASHKPVNNDKNDE